MRLMGAPPQRGGSSATLLLVHFEICKKRGHILRWRGQKGGLKEAEEAPPQGGGSLVTLPLTQVTISLRIPYLK